MRSNEWSLGHSHRNTVNHSDTLHILSRVSSLKWTVSIWKLFNENAVISLLDEVFLKIYIFKKNIHPSIHLFIYRFHANMTCDVSHHSVSALFHIHELTDMHDLLLSLWLTGEIGLASFAPWASRHEWLIKTVLGSSPRSLDPSVPLSHLPGMQSCH